MTSAAGGTPAVLILRHQHQEPILTHGKTLVIRYRSFLSLNNIGSYKVCFLKETSDQRCNLWEGPLSQSD